MFLVDTVFSHGHQQYHSPLTELTQDYHELSNDPINANQVSAISKRRSYSAMIGLIIHSAADGLALGAAGHSNSQWIIFMALMLHKAPAAFGLTSFLIKDGLSRRNVRGALFMFSIAAPISIFLLKIAAIITSLLIDLSGYEDTTGSSMFWSGVVLLFSGGAFLYVSLVHILPEIYINSASSPSAHPSKGQLTVMQVILVVLGIFSPFFLAMGHHH
jgi:zinc transporter 9